jgi:Ni,Fe-hydrogenase I cytochrome b subunit
MVLAAVTGFAIYHGNILLVIDSQAAFGWVNVLLGGESITRIIHILIMWCFIVFMIIHVYLSWMNSAVKKDNSFTSIFTGYKLHVDH